MRLAFRFCMNSSVPRDIVLQVQTCLETKGGPIQTAAIHNVTKFVSNDLIVGDSRGMLTVFSNGQILSRQTLSDNSIQCLQVEEDASKYIIIW
jgi:hypothetical protein